MLNGQCPRCGSKTVYKMLNGVRSSSGGKVYVRGSGFIGSPATDRMTLVCVTCGFYENYLTDKSILHTVSQKWDKVG